MAYGPPYIILEYGNLVMGSPTCTIWFAYGNLVTIHHLWSHTLYGMWEPCNYQWLMVPHTLYGMQVLCNCQWHISPIPYIECGNLVSVNELWFPHTLYGMQEPCNRVPTCTIWFACGNLVTVNKSYGPPIPYMECGNIVIVNDLWSPYLIWNVGICYCQWLMVPTHLTWKCGTL